MLYYIQGLTMGLAYVAPIGMQNLFVINTALRQSKRRVLFTALSVIFFDITLTLICFFGIGGLMDCIPILNKLILLVGSIVVLTIGIQCFRTKEEKLTEIDTNLSLVKVIWNACVVTWFNPQAILDGTMLLGAFRSSMPAEEAGKFVIGIATASTVWFLGLSGLISLWSKHFTSRFILIINKVCGIVIIFYGLRLAATLIRGLI